MHILTSIKSKIFVSHFALLVILLTGLSYTHYYNSLNTYINNVITFHKNSSASIVRTASLAISGQNYGNIQLPSFVKELTSNEKLFYLQITGKSDFSSKDFSVLYTKKSANIHRNLYPKNYEQKLQNKLARFQSKLNDSTIDKVKLNFLIERTTDALFEYKKNMESPKSLDKQYEKILKKESGYIDSKNNLLILSLKTNNKNSGLISMVFDISEIKTLKKKIITDLLIESLISLLVASFLLNILANKIIGPLNELSKFISNDEYSLNPNNMPALNSKDEIGFLAHKFKRLIKEMQEKQAIIEDKAYFDNLTGIYNRHKFDVIWDEEIKRTKRYKHPITIAIIDIDKFKNFNDTHGHLIGDEVLVMMAHCVRDNLRDTDTLARWGGEEFIIMFKDTQVEDAVIASNMLRVAIQNLVHPVAGGITASFGVSEYIETDTQESIFKRCDEALYKAKDNGRNCVVQY